MAQTAADVGGAQGGEFPADHSHVHARPDLRARAPELLIREGPLHATRRHFDLTVLVTGNQ